MSAELIDEAYCWDMWYWEGLPAPVSDWLWTNDPDLATFLLWEYFIPDDQPSGDWDREYTSWLNGSSRTGISVV